MGGILAKSARKTPSSVKTADPPTSSSQWQDDDGDDEAEPVETSFFEWEGDATIKKENSQSKMATNEKSGWVDDSSLRLHAATQIHTASKENDAQYMSQDAKPIETKQESHEDLPENLEDENESLSTTIERQSELLHQTPEKSAETFKNEKDTKSMNSTPKSAIKSKPHRKPQKEAKTHRHHHSSHKQNSKKLRGSHGKRRNYELHEINDIEFPF